MKNYRVTYRDGSTKLVDGQDVVSWHHGDVAYIEREDVVRVSPREFAERVKGIASTAARAMGSHRRSKMGNHPPSTGDFLLALKQAVEEFEELQTMKEQAQ